MNDTTERNVYSVDVGDMPVEEAAGYIRAMMELHKAAPQTVVDAPDLTWASAHDGMFANGIAFYPSDNHSRDPQDWLCAKNFTISLDQLKAPEPEPEFKYKYREGEILAEIEAYIKSTYGAHYGGDDGSIQAIDAIVAAGNGPGFFMGDIQKYSFRQGKKAGQERNDIVKIIHYGILMLWLHDRMQARKEAK